MRYVISIFCLGFIFLLTSTCIAEKFPFREQYPEITILELSELKSGYDSGIFLVIDIRSRSEFDVIHIKNAINLPYADSRCTQK